MTSSRFAFVARRLLGLVPLMLGVLLLVILILAITPGDPARLAVGLRASDEDVDAAREAMGLNLPVWEQYLRYLANAVRGDFGSSFQTGQPVLGQILDQLPVTLAVVAAGVVVALLISVPLSLAAAAYRDKAIDHLVRGFGVLAIGLPAFWVAVMLISFVALPTGVFPVAGIGSTPAETLLALVLPGIAIGISICPPLIRSMRATVLEVRSAEYVVAARSLGFSGRSLTWRFIVRNALPPVVTVTAGQASFALFGAVVVEVAFGLPGMGQGLVAAANQRDFPLVQGYTVVFAALIVAIYLIADIVNSTIDPRVTFDA